MDKTKQVSTAGMQHFEYLGHFNGPSVMAAGHNTVTKVDMGKKGSFSIHKGALHRALGVPQGEKIPESKMESAEHSKNAHVRNMARSAKGLEGMSHKR